MTEQEQARKLAQIAKLDAGELIGWNNRVYITRGYFRGEHAALLARAKHLGVKL